MTVDKIYLVGFMGAGKTTVGRALGRRLGWPVIDVDEQVEQREGRRVSMIFARDGEAYFRAVERHVIHALLPTRQAIIATGGGTFADPESRSIMLADGGVAWLDLPLSGVIARVPPDGRRPLAADREQMTHLFETRQIAYSQAHVRIDASRPVPEVVERLLEWIGY